MSETTKPTTSHSPIVKAPTAKPFHSTARQQEGEREESSRRRREKLRAKLAAMTAEELEAYGREIASVW